MAGITLAQLAQVEKDPETKFMELSILRECKIMERIPFENVSSLQIRAQFWQTLPTGGAFRSINEGYTSAEDGQLGEEWEAVYGFGGDITYDNVLEMIKNTAKDPVQLQTEGKLRTMALQYNDNFINGDVAVDPKGFNGIKKRVAGMPSRQRMTWTTSSSAAPLDPTASAALARRFLNVLRTAWVRCNAGQVNAILCNEDFILGIGAALVYAQSTGNYLDVTKDQFDRDVTTYRGVPLVDMGYKSDLSTEIIPTTETAGDAGADSTSVYFTSINTQDGVYGIQLNPFKVYDPLGGGELSTKPSKMKRVDWWNGLATFGTRGIVRVSNLARIADWTEA